MMQLAKLCIGGPLHGKYEIVVDAPTILYNEVPDGQRCDCVVRHKYTSEQVCLHNGEYERVLIYEGATE